MKDRLDRRKTFSCMLPDGASRIDDVLISSCSKLAKGSPEEVPPPGERSDHLPLKITLILPKSPSSRASPDANDTDGTANKVPQGFQGPLAPGQKQMLRSHLEGFQMIEVSQIAEQIRGVYEEAKDLHHSSMCHGEPNEPVSTAARTQFAHELEQKLITKGTVDAMAVALTGLISRINLAALDVLPAMPKPANRKLFRPRAMGRNYQALRMERASLVRKLLRRHKVKDKDGSSPGKSASGNPLQSADALPSTQEEAKAEAKTRYRQAGQQMKALQHQQMHQSRQVQVKKLQQILHANRKRGHKIIFGGDSPA